MIVMTPAQAALVKGISSPGYSLDPVLLVSGNFVLEESVLTDPAHATKRATLAAFPMRAVLASEYPVNAT